MMPKKTHIVKRKGHIERFDERKVYASTYDACRSCHMQRQECEKIAAAVTTDVKRWVRTKTIVKSDAISRVVANSLRKKHKHAAFMYETHRDVS